MPSYARSVALTGSDQGVLTGPGVYRGICLRETAASTAAVRVYDGTSATGTIIGAYSLAAGGSADVVLDGIYVTIGIYVDVISGAVEGSVRVG